MAPSERARQVLTAARTDPAAAHRLAGWYEGGEEGLHQSVELAFRQGLAGELLATSRGPRRKPGASSYTLTRLPLALSPPRHRISFNPRNEGLKCEVWWMT